MAGERTALLLGATGLVGSELLRVLLDDPGFARVTTLGRRPTGIAHPRLVEHRAGLDRLDEQEDAFREAVVFCCLGTTLRRAGSREGFRAVDLGAVARASAAARRAAAPHFLLVSAAGADPRSRIFYHRVKGEAEQAVISSGVPRVTVLRPSLLLGERSERRPAERLAQHLGRVLGPLLVGPLRRVRPVAASSVARAMHAQAREEAPGVRIVGNDEIFSLAASGIRR